MPKKYPEKMTVKQWRDGFLKNLKFHLQATGLTQTQIAKRLGCTVSFVSNVYAGRMSPSLQNMLEICVEFDIDPASLFEVTHTV